MNVIKLVGPFTGGGFFSSMFAWFAACYHAAKDTLPIQPYLICDFVGTHKMVVIVLDRANFVSVISNVFFPFECVRVFKPIASVSSLILSKGSPQLPITFESAW